jgi:hypothetical protein
MMRKGGRFAEARITKEVLPLGYKKPPSAPSIGDITAR